MLKLINVVKFLTNLLKTRKQFSINSSILSNTLLYDSLKIKAKLQVKCLPNSYYTLIQTHIVYGVLICNSIM